MKTAEEQNNIAAKQQTFQLRRRKARCLAMQFIFQMDMNKQCRCDQEQLSRFQETWLEDENQRKAWKYARKIIEATCENLEEIDRLLQKAASNWSLPRMSYIARSIMRIAVSEIAFTEKKLPVIAINEAVELAKIYSEAASAAFVNGILDKVRKTLA